MPHLSASTWSPSLSRWRRFTMTADGLRLLQDLRRSLLEPARQPRPRAATRAAAGDAPETVRAAA
jgi:hypothetical protein